MANYGEHVRARQATAQVARNTPQTEPISADQHANPAGGYVWSPALMQQVRRFLILGTVKGSYYAGEKELTIANVECLAQALQADGRGVVDMIVSISDKGDAPKNDPAIFALAYAASHGTPDVKAYALANLNKVVRTGTHLFQFVAAVETQRGWGRSVRSAVAGWYNGKSARDVAFQMAKYQQRNGWSHQDVIRLAHVKPATAAHEIAYGWAVGKKGTDAEGMPEAIRLLGQFQAAASKADILKLIAANQSAAWEFIPTQYLGEADVWEALLPNVPLGALVRNLGRLTANGLLKANSNAAKLVRQRLGDQDQLRKARVHPIAILSALRVYEQGHGEKGHLSWTAVQSIKDALDAAFYMAFGFLPKDEARYAIGVDVSGSMATGEIAGIAGMTPNLAAGAMAMVIARTSPEYFMIGFDTNPKELRISATSTLDQVLREIKPFNYGGTDAAVLVNYAMQRKLAVDKFVILTDNETWAGRTHVPQAAAQYRQRYVADAKLIEIAMTAGNSSICDPNDPLMLDVVGFDVATPKLVAAF